MNRLLAFLTENVLRRRRRQLRSGGLRYFVLHPRPFPKGQGVKRFHVHVGVQDPDASVRF